VRIQAAFENVANNGMNKNSYHQKGVAVLFSTLIWCLSLAWKTSKLYTVAQIGSQILNPVLTILAAFMRSIYSILLAGSWVVVDASRTLSALFIAMLSIAILRVAMEKLNQYSQSMQGNSQKQNRYLNDGSMLSSDLEYFDNPFIMTVFIRVSGYISNHRCFLERVDMRQHAYFTYWRICSPCAI